jgi:hypothetical protein
MPAFEQVEDKRAGSRALGILVPPGERTMVILRPRGLGWDLLPIRFDRGLDSSFCNFARADAVAFARQLRDTLDQAAKREERPVQIVTNPAGDGFWVWMPMLDVMWIVCPRIPGRPYEPCVFADRDQAQKAIDRLAPYLWPGENARQEIYLNTRNFSATHPGAAGSPPI